MEPTYIPIYAAIVQYALDNSLLTHKEIRKVTLTIVGLPQDETPDKTDPGPIGTVREPNKSDRGPCW